MGSNGLKACRVPDQVAGNGESVGRPSHTVRGHQVSMPYIATELSSGLGCSNNVDVTLEL